MRIWKIICAVSCLIFLMNCNSARKENDFKSQSALPEIITTVFKNDTTRNTSLGGFGYKIEVITGGDTFRIIQPVVPAIQGNKGFSTGDDAAKVAELVAGKMKAGNSFPTVGLKELDSLGIKY